MNGSDEASSAREGSKGLTPQRIVALLLAVLVVAFIVQNRATVTLSLLTIQVSAPLWMAFLATAVLGALIGWLLTGRAARRSRER